jgi:DNA polymerase-3 subunit alpha
MKEFTHLHVHTQFSILDGASDIPDLIAKVKNDGMTALAITDHGNMFGAKLFHDTANKQGIKPIIGCEVYVARRTRFNKTDLVDRSGDHLILLAKNHVGYHNLVKLVSLAFIEGLYYKPRIDKELLEKYHEGLIVSSACLGGEIPQKIMKENEAATEEAMLWFKGLFGDDYYLELQRHKSGIPEKDADVYENQLMTNEVILRLAAKHNIKVIATNDVHFINEEDAEAHDRLICLNTGKDIDDPTRMQYSKQEFLKTRQEMYQLFADIPEVLENTQEIVDKIENYKLNSDPIMPDFPLPEGFDNEDDYLRHVTYEGAKERYPVLTDDIRERIDFELNTVKKMGFPGYFLITWDFIKAAREMGVIVGPGRGSAAGSVVAYSIKITNIDPLKYDLLFERFLNPDRISMPDIDIDFDDDGRQMVLDWVVEKYGYDKVSHIITFGTMAAKMAIRDIARVQKLPLPEADRLAKLVPDGPNVTIKKAYEEVPELREALKSDNENLITTLKYAETLEGSVRHSGVHACGIIIGKHNLIENIPVCTSKDTDLLITQYDGRFVEPVGMLKMDFLGLKTLSIIKESIENIKLSKGIDIDIDNIPLDDELTFRLYSRGETTALFQFESPGMKKHLRNLQPNRFEDLVAMNALYRPGPMEYIPSFINRKHGREKIVYDHPIMEDYLKDTYGITVYQEQVMLQSRALAGFTRGQSDSLRKAMGKKKMSLMAQLKKLFVEGCYKNEKFVEGCQQMKADSDKLIEKIWNDWEAFAKYAFNKSHSVCYAYVSYQTAYLKAHYPAEFMAAVLSRNLNDIKKITLFMDECRYMGMDVLSPDVNESYSKFTVNKKGAIRFGLGAIKGVGEAAVKNIIEVRNKNGLFEDIFNFVERINLTTVSKRTLENIALAGGLDCFDNIKRHQYFFPVNKDSNFIEIIAKYGNSIQNESGAAPSLFGDAKEYEVPKPEIPQCEEWSQIEKLNKEKELIGIYLSAHPLDAFKLEIETYCNASLSQFNDLKKLNGRDLKIGGIVVQVEHRTTKTGNPFGTLTIEDYSGAYRIMMFSRDYLNFKSYFTVGYSLFITGKVQQRYNNSELEFKVTNINMLSEVREKMVKSLAIKVPLSKLTEELINDVREISESNKGNTELQFLIYEPSTKIWVQMFSRSHRINLTNQVIDFLKKNSEIEYKIY